jgi:lysophospholipase L1-like esterase
LAKHAHEEIKSRASVIALGFVCVALMAMLAVSLSSGATRPASDVDAVPSYYVALGDSISAGDYASSPLSSFVGLVYLHELTRDPSLVLVNLACGSQATTDMIAGSALCDYNVSSQLDHATSFLSAHRGQVRFVTIDIGINDVVQGATSRQIFLNLLHILLSIQHADPGVEIVGMDYYDPFLGNPADTPAWGPPSAFAALNSTIAGAYRYASVPIVNANALFGTTPTRLCALTFQCPSSPLENIHPTDAGYAVLAKGFEAVLDKG